MAGTLPPLFTISENDHGGYVAVALYTFLILMVGLVVTRVFTRWYIVRSIKADDCLLILASLLGILQSVLIQLAINNGLGRKREIVTDGEFELYQKYEYAAQILLVATLACAKISLALLIRSLLAGGYSILAGRGLLGVIVAWAVSSMLVLAFRCSLPHPWDSSGECVDHRAIHISISSLNIATDALLILLPSIVVWKVHLSPDRRNRILGLFATRIIVCVVAAVELYYFERFISSSDKTWGNIDSSVWDQVMMNVSIMFTAIPSLGRLLVELQPAVNAFAITEQHGLRSGDKYALSSLAGRFPHDYAVSNRLGVHTSVGSMRGSGIRESDLRRGSRVDGKSVKGLRDVGLSRDIDSGVRDWPIVEEGRIRQTVDFMIH